MGSTVRQADPSNDLEEVDRGSGSPSTQIGRCQTGNENGEGETHGGGLGFAEVKEEKSGRWIAADLDWDGEGDWYVCLVRFNLVSG